MDVNSRAPISGGDPAAPDRTDAYSYKPVGDVDRGGGSPHPAGDVDRDGAHPHVAEAWRSVVDKLGELGEYAGHYLAAKSDAFKLTMRNVAVMAALGIIGLIAAGGLVVTAVVLLCVGIAHGIAALLGGRMWAGELITGVLLLGLLAGG